MTPWTISLIVVASWCALSVPLAIVLGHAMAGKSLREPTPVPVERPTGVRVFDKAS